MICTACNNGFMCESFPEPLYYVYRGFKRIVATQVYLECSNCSNRNTEPFKEISVNNLSIEENIACFKIEINIKFSTYKIE